MENTTIFIIIATILGLLFGVWIGIGITEPQIQEVYYESEVPMLLVEFESWGENIDDSSETVFSYFVYNFGNTEAKNVKVRCEVTDSNDEVVREETFNVGNAASNSYEWQTSTIKEKFTDNHMGACYLDSAAGEYINLQERLKDI